MDVEKRSIEFIPLDERYGSPVRLFFIWFSSNMQVTALIIGSLGVLAGLNAFWGVVAAVLGTGFGSVFMAAHSAQGPHLGIPQMVQSRAQFGVLGAGFPLAVIVIAYILFTAANGVVMRSSIQAAVPLSDNNSIILFGLVTLVIAFVGYRLIHGIAVWMSALSLILFLCVTYFAASHRYPADAWSPSIRGFKFQAFMIGLMGATSWTLCFAAYVADYSRYLPVNVKTSSTFWYSYCGQFFGAGFVMALGAALTSFVPHLLEDPGRAIAGMFPAGRWIVYVVIVLGVLEINVMNIYSAYMSGTTIFTGFRGIARISKTGKFATMALMSFIATAIAVGTQYNFAAYFSDILIAQIYFIIPWSAINLCDFYLVRFGRYNVSAIYDEAGEYGRYNRVTIVIMLVTAIIEIPFMDLSFYVGPVAKIFGTDVTIFVNFLVPGALYYLTHRKRAAAEHSYA